MRAAAFGLTAAIVIHLAVLGFGGILFPRPEAETRTVRVEDVDLLAGEDDPSKEEKKPEDPPAEEAEADSEEAMEVAAVKPPDLNDLALLQEQAATAAVPSLEALSLGALESALNPGSGAGADFGGGLSLSSGGRIGGTGSASGVAAGGPEEIFSFPELDQKPRALFQAAPLYPFEMRQKNVEGTVYVLFVVDQEGRVVNPTVEKSTHRAFEKPAIDAVRQWKFEPAVRNGEPVQARLRVSIRFARG
jgi:protein TonB